MSKRRTETWLLLAVIGIGLIPAGLAGLWGYMGATATVLHPRSDDVGSVVDAAPLPRWAGAAQHARQAVRAALAGQNLPGLSVAVGVGGEMAWAEGFGWADLERRVPVAPDTKFRIGTASIPLTSVAVGVLLEHRRLSLDEGIRTYVPAIPPGKWPVTLRQLMGHVAGVANDGGDEGPLFSQHCERPVDAVQHLSGYELELVFDPGTRFRHSSYGWILVSAAVEHAAVEPFLTFMRKEVFEPAGMRHTEADSATEPIASRATPYFPRFASDPRYGLQLMRPLDYSCYAGASAFLSTPSDLVRFGMALSGGSLLQPATVALLQDAQRLSSGESTGYGLGWDIEDVTLAGAPTKLIGHDGELLGGMASSLMMFPERGIIVALVSNMSYADTFSLGLSIAEAFVSGTGSAASAAPIERFDGARPPSGQPASAR